MPEIEKIEDAYIDDVIKSSAVYNPNLDVTQGVRLRELVKLLRDRSEQEVSESTMAATAGLAGKADLVAGTVPFNQLPKSLQTFTDITYGDLVAAMNGSTLKAGSLYRITDFQTVHYISNVSPAMLNTGPVEPLIFLALASNKISTQACSEMYPQDMITYTTDNSKIPGAVKGCILRRVDTILNNDVCNDFRNVKYRRWRLAPVLFNPAVAYSQYATIQGPDGALYYLAKPGGFTAGSAATTPSLTNDDWVQVFINNNYYYSRSGAATTTVSITSNQNPSHPSPKFNVNTTDFIDTVMFPNYGAGFSNIQVNNGLASLPNLVFFNDNQASIVRGLKIGSLEIGGADITSYSTTFVLSGSGRMADVEFKHGIGFSFITLTGPCTSWVAEDYLYAITVNCTSINFCNFSAFYSVLRGVLYQLRGRRMEYLVTPLLFWDIYFPIGMGNLKFNTTSNAKGWSVLNGLGKAILNDGTIQSTMPDVVVDSPLSWKTFLGCTDITSSAAHGSSADLSAQITKAKNRAIVYAVEDPIVS